MYSSHCIHITALLIIYYMIFIIESPMPIHTILKTAEVTAEVTAEMKCDGIRLRPSLW